MGTEGAQTPAPLDATDKAALQNAELNSKVMAPCTPDNPHGGALPDQHMVNQIHERANRKAELAHAMDAGGARMRVDPAEVDALAKFFEDEAQGLLGRAREIQKLSQVTPPGLDPVSKDAAKVYGQVGEGNAQAYMDNYLKLADTFNGTAANLRKNAQQTRTDDQNAADGFRGGVRA